MEVKDLQQYEIIINKHIEEVNSNAYLLRHKKTGARVVILSNDDDNKVFNIGFRTPVTDDTYYRTYCFMWFRRFPGKGTIYGIS